MARLNKRNTALIRSAKPVIQPDRDFVSTLQIQLQNRAHHMHIPITQNASRKSRRIWFGSFGFGAVALALVVAMVAPNWFTKSDPLTGYIQKGPFISGTAITVQELDDRLQPTGTSYQVTTSSDFGDYHLNQSIQSDFVEVIANGFYYDEVRGKLSSAPLTLRAIAEVSSSQVVNVNILTTLSTPRIRHILAANDMPFSLAKHIAEQEVLSVFQITDPNIKNFESMNISQAGTNNGILLAVSVLVQGKLSVAELSELLAKLSLAIRTDGTIHADGPLIEKIRANAQQLNTDQIQTNLINRFQKVGEPGVVPDFVPFLEPFVTISNQ